MIIIKFKAKKKKFEYRVFKVRRNLFNPNSLQMKKPLPRKANWTPSTTQDHNFTKSEPSSSDSGSNGLLLFPLLRTDFRDIIILYFIIFTNFPITNALGWWLWEREFYYFWYFLCTRNYIWHFIYIILFKPLHNFMKWELFYSCFGDK